MKKFFVALTIMLAALTASAQHHHGHHGGFEHRDGGRRGRFEHLHGNIERRQVQPRFEVRCVRDWQELWNGCHVRIKLDRISIYNAQGDRLIWADEVSLLPSGLYKVRNGEFWYIYSSAGNRLGNVWGDAIDVMPNGLFRCYRAGMVFYYDTLGNERQ